MAILTLLTDFGRDDYYVGAVKGVLLASARAPLTLVDLGHDVAPGDIEGAAFLLAAAAPTFPPATVHLAVVDPGVGSARRILVVASGGHRFVAPDNGLLTPILRREDAVAVAVTADELFRDAPGHTFHGRDRFAPVAAALADGREPDSLGTPIVDPVRLDLPAPQRRGTHLVGRIVHVDRFGNLVTDLPADWLAGDDRDEIVLRVGDRDRRARRVATYVDLAEGEAGILVGSLGTLELSLDGASLAERWAVARGARVEIR